MNKKIFLGVISFIFIVALLITHRQFINVPNHFQSSDVHNSPKPTTKPYSRSQSGLEKTDGQENSVGGHLDDALGHFGL
jgi:hypothetical protein